MDFFRRKTRYATKLVSDLDMDAIEAALPNEMFRRIMELINTLESDKTSPEQKEAIFKDCREYIKTAKGLDETLQGRLAHLEDSEAFVRTIIMGERYMDRLEEAKKDPISFEPLFPLPKLTVPALSPYLDSATTAAATEVPDASDASDPETTVSTLESTYVSKNEVSVDEGVHVLSTQMSAHEEISVSSTIESVAAELAETDVLHVSEGLDEADSMLVDKTPDLDTKSDVDAVVEGEIVQDDSVEPVLAVELDEKEVPVRVNSAAREDRQQRIQDYIAEDQSSGSTISFTEGAAYTEEPEDEAF